MTVRAMTGSRGSPCDCGGCTGDAPLAASPATSQLGSESGVDRLVPAAASKGAAEAGRIAARSKASVKGDRRSVKQQEAGAHLAIAAAAQGMRRLLPRRRRRRGRRRRSWSRSRGWPVWSRPLRRKARQRQGGSPLGQRRWSKAIAARSNNRKQGLTLRLRRMHRECAARCLAGDVAAGGGARSAALLGIRLVLGRMKHGVSDISRTSTKVTTKIIQRNCMWRLGALFSSCRFSLIEVKDQGTLLILVQ